MRQVGSVLWPKLKALQVYGANTGVGKTVISAVVCRAFERRHGAKHTIRYVKPISTGPLNEADDRYVALIDQFSDCTKSKITLCLTRTRIMRESQSDLAVVICPPSGKT